jgi:hypothetical protein
MKVVHRFQGREVMPSAVDRGSVTLWHAADAILNEALSRSKLPLLKTLFLNMCV